MERKNFGMKLGKSYTNRWFKMLQEEQEIKHLADELNPYFIAEEL